LVLLYRITHEFMRGEATTSTLRSVAVGGQESVQVAVAGVRVVESARDVVVHMVAVGNALVPAGGPVRLTALDGRAGARPRGIHLEPVLVEVALVGRVKVSVVEIVRVVAVAHGLVAAARPVLVGVAVIFAAGHDRPPATSSRAGTRGSTVG
jgi:hypothetical protein